MKNEKILKILKIFTIVVAVGLILCIYYFLSINRNDVEKFAKLEQWDSYEVEGVCWFGCGKDDFYSTKFTATRNGQIFSGCVCSGFIFKNATLRLD